MSTDQPVTFAALVARNPRVCVIVANRLYDPSMDVGRITQVARRVRMHAQDVIVLGRDDGYSCNNRDVRDVLQKLKENAGLVEIAVPDDELIRGHQIAHSLQTGGRKGGLMNAILGFKDGRQVHAWRAGDRTPDTHHAPGDLSAFR